MIKGNGFDLKQLESFSLNNFQRRCKNLSDSLLYWKEIAKKLMGDYKNVLLDLRKESKQIKFDYFSTQKKIFFQFEKIVRKMYKNFLKVIYFYFIIFKIIFKGEK